LGRLALTITIVSTVLRPVGPHQARVYWVRRAVLVALIVVIVVVLVAVLSGGGSGKPTPKASTPAPQTTTSTHTVTPVAACDPTALKLVMSTDSDTYTSGQTPKLIGEFSNLGAAPCTLASAPTREVWTVTSGPETVWTTSGCPTTDRAAPKTLTIKAGGTKQVSIVWDGAQQEPGCTVGAVAQPGTYVLRAKLDGVQGTPAIFHITS
jgi:hypothetical protein